MIFDFFWKGVTVMQKVKRIYLSSIMMFCEIIWIYYAIVMFSSIEWDHQYFFDLTWFVLAGVMGYAINTLLDNNINNVVMLLLNILIMGLLIVKNWTSVVPTGSSGFGVGVSIGLSLIYIRSTRLIQRLPVRGEVLRHFEGNILFYIIFAVVFTVNKWSDSTFHLFFMFAILNSLMAMVLTLQNLEDVGGNSIIEIMKVGRPGWFAGAASMVLISIPVLSLLLLLPSVNKVLYILGIRVVQSLKWMALKIYWLFVWFLGLFPNSGTKVSGGIPPERQNISSNAMENTFTSLPYMWLIIVIAILFIVVSIWYLKKVINSRQHPKTMKPKHIVIYYESWWIILKRKLISLLKSLKLRYLMNFSGFYYQPIYWYYHQVLRWGKKNGLTKLKSETSQEYIKKIISNLPEEETNFSQKNRYYHLPELLKRLNKDYQATYYGFEIEISEEPEYKLLINHLKHIRLKQNILCKK